MIKEETTLQKLILMIDANDNAMDCILKAKKLFEKERENIIRAYSSGFDNGKWATNGNDSIYHAKKYFKRKYK